MASHEFNALKTKKESKKGKVHTTESGINQALEKTVEKTMKELTIISAFKMY